MAIKLHGTPPSLLDIEIAKEQQAEYLVQLKEAQERGRYPLYVAAKLMAQHAGFGISEEMFYERLKSDVINYVLPSYQFKQNVQWKGKMPLLSLLEIDWKDLNAWRRHEFPKIEFKFSAPPAKQISKAPPPISPIRGTGTIIRRRRPEEKPADWGLWKSMIQAEVWEAVALSMNIEPETLAGYDHHPINKDPFEDCSPEFRKRLKIACSHIKGNVLKSVLARFSTSNSVVALSVFAAWAITTFSKEKIPQELVAIAEDKHAPFVAPQAEPNWSIWKNKPMVQLWQAVALSLNLEPDTHEMYGAFDPERCKTMPKDFFERLKIACDNPDALGIFDTQENKYVPRWLRPVNILTFGAWARSIDDFTLPDEFPNGIRENLPPVDGVPKDKGREKWTTARLKELLELSREPGMTHQKIADKYGVSRQFIGRKLLEAKPKKANAFTQMVKSNHK